MALTKVTYSMIEGAPFNVLDYGAVGDGVANDTVAIQNAIDAAFAAGGGVVSLPAGTYLVSTSALTETLWNYGVSFSSANTCLILRSNVHLVGEGVNLTKIQNNDPTKSLITISDGNNVRISGMTVDGAWSGTGAGQGIWQLLSTNDNATVCQNMVFEDLFISNIGSYALGVENGNCYNVYVSNVRTFNSGADAIDFKNRGSTQNNTGIFVSNLYIEKYGQRVSLGSGQTGIDIRGVANINNIQVKMTSAVGIGHTGIRFRTATNVSPGEEWGAKSSLTNFYIYSDDTSSVNTDNVGLNVGSKDVTISNGYIENCYRGVVVGGNATDVPTNVAISQVNVSNSSNYAFFTGVGCDYARLVSCSANNSGVGFRVESNYTNVISCQAFNTTTEISPSTGANPTLLQWACNFGDDFGFTSGGGTGVVSLSPKGTSTDIDIQFIPKGAGKLKWGVSQAITTETLDRYIEVKDQGGNIRKLAIVA